MVKVFENIVERIRDNSDSIDIPTELGTYIIVFFVMSVQLVYTSTSLAIATGSSIIYFKEIRLL